jgi:hypothetical protein
MRHLLCAQHSKSKDFIYVLQAVQEVNTLLKRKKHNVRFQILTVASMKMTAFLDIVLCSLNEGE